ncbi:AarF/ABC1/UbiB kinase family protein [Anaerolineales bacterium HSG24]|nr:AarF/ABC1/UbiB kinase family protein [Anaerolineales bacterium HSG24]
MLSKIELVGRTYRHVQRYRQILVVLSKYGFDNLVDSLTKVEQRVEYSFAQFFRRPWQPSEILTRAERARMVIEELGPTFIKMGQVLSTRPDVLPHDFIHEFAKLQQAVPPFPFEEAKQIIELELRMPLDEMYTYFEETPLAAASFGQVHRAKMKDGADVVVKVQRPGIQRIVAVDLEIMQHVATLLERRLDGWQTHRPTLVVEEFTRVLELELDYTIESSHMERFTWQFTYDHTVHIPKIYREAITTRVLTMEYIDGFHIFDLEQLEQANINRQEVARRGFRLILEQIFVNGFFHADPHPGNLLILPENIICYLDFGMMGRIDLRSRENCADLILAIIKRNEIKTTNALLQLTIYDTKPERAALEKEVASFLDQYSYRPLKEIELGKLLNQLLDVTTRHNLRIPPDLFLMMKALTTAEGIGRALDPDFDPIQQAQPFVWRIYTARLDPRRILRDAYDNTTEFAGLLREIPDDLHDLLRQTNRGELRFKLALDETKPLIATIDRISNMLAFSIVLAALIIGSSLILVTNTNSSYQWNGLSTIALIGFVVAGVMGFALLLAILRRGLV